MNFPPLTHIALAMLALDFLRYLLGAGLVWLVVNVLLRQRLAGRRILDARARPGQAWREFSWSMSTVLIFAAVGTLFWLLGGQGWLRVYHDVARYGWLWWWASLVLVVVAHDAYFYWTHRLLHHRRWFAAIHGRHHRSVQPTPWAAYSFHPVEAAIQAAFLPIFAALVPIHRGAIGLFLLHMILRNAAGHCSHELLPWRWTRRGALAWITPVTHHHFHHARNRGNYGLYFTWWDRWCGTEDSAYLQHGDSRFTAGAQATAGAARAARPAAPSHGG